MYILLVRNYFNLNMLNSKLKVNTKHQISWCFIILIQNKITFTFKVMYVLITVFDNSSLTKKNLQGEH